jgi:amidase
MSEIWKLDAVAQAGLRARGEVAPDELVRAAVERAERVDGDVNSIVHPRFGAAVAEAGGATGVLAGVPMVVKDWKCLQAGEPAGWATAALQDRRAKVSSHVAQAYTSAGLVSIGRSNLPELAFGPPTTEPAVHGACRNPWDRRLSVGGSSGGSAAAVAAGIVPVANASDGGGSLRIPAAACGLVGLKVSRGRISNAPHSDGRAACVTSPWCLISWAATPPEITSVVPRRTCLFGR